MEKIRLTSQQILRIAEHNNARGEVVAMMYLSEALCYNHGFGTGRIADISYILHALCNLIGIEKDKDLYKYWKKITKEIKGYCYEEDLELIF